MADAILTDARQRLAAARLWAADKLPYMAHQVLSLIPMPTPGLGTMAVDQYLRLAYDPKFVCDHTLEEMGFVLLHEALHPLLMHHKRRPGLIGLAPDPGDLCLYRQAADAAINDTLVRSGLDCPEEGVTPDKLKLPVNLTMEEYYRRLKQRREEEKEAQRQQQAQEAAESGQQSEESEDDLQGHDNPTDPGTAGPGDGEGSETPDQQDQPQGGQSEGDLSDDQQQGQGEAQDPNGPESDGIDAGDPGGDGDGAEANSEKDAVESGGHSETSGEGEPSHESGHRASGDGSYDGSGVDRSQGDGGSGCDSIPRPWEAPPPEEGQAPGMSEADQDQLRRVVAKAAEEYQRQGRGTVPGELARMVEGILHPKVDPVRELQARVRHAVTSTHGFGDYTWRKRPRRTPPGAGILPAHVQPKPQVTVIVDTSGSMREADLKLALGTIAKVCQGIPNPRGVRVLAGDTEAAFAKNVFRHDQVELLGGGGTSMATIIGQACQEKPEPNVILVVTDGYTDWPDKPPRPRIVAALTRKATADSVPKWIEKVVLEV